MKRLFLFLAAALPLLADPAPADHGDLESYLAPMKEAAKAGNIGTTRQVYLNYGMAGKQEQAKEWADLFLKQLHNKAEAGDVKAMNTLGRVYLLGDSCIASDAAQARLWFTKASEAGDPAAAYMLGDMLDKQKQPAEAKVAYARAYGLYRGGKTEEDRYWAACMLLAGLGCTPDVDAATTELSELADAHYLPAAYQLFRYYASVGKDEQALPYAKQLADEAQDAQMNYLVADACLKGKGLPRDEAEGMRRLEQAAAAGVPAALFHRAWLLDEAGKAEDAYPLYLRAAGQGHADAAVKVGTMLLNGRGTDKDEAQGIAWLQRANDTLKSPIAPYELGRYYDSVGEHALADSWYIIASDRGLAEAMARRGLLHLIPGSGVKWDPTEAYRWWKQGCSVNDPTCKLYLQLYLYVFTPLLLVLAFGVPVFIVNRLNRKVEKAAALAEHKG